jgi:1,4-dihydroxy-2-naphthoate octaprenyltransferase
MNPATAGRAARRLSPALALRAMRAPFLSVTALALAVGFALPAVEALPWAAMTLAAAGALLAHGGANALNDWADEQNGSDRANAGRVAPFTGGSRLIQDGCIEAAATRRLALALLTAAAGCGLLLLPLAGAPLIAYGLLGLALAWAYSAPPLSLMARGTGEAAVGLAWLTVIAGADFVVRGETAVAPWIAGAGFALTVVALLWVNQLPDLAADRLAGKRNLAVRLGAARAVALYPPLVVAAALAHALACALDALPPSSLLALAGLAPAVIAARALRAWRRGSLEQADAPTQAALATAVRANLVAVHAYGILLAATLALA